MAVIISDNFNRANSATTLGSTPVGNKPWTIIGNQVWGINNNLMYPVTPVWDSPVYVETGLADNFAAQFKVGVYTSDQQFMWRFMGGTTQQYFVLQGSRVLRANGTAFPEIYSGATLVAGDIIRVECRGSQHKIYRNGVVWAEFTDTAYMTGTKVGFGAKDGVPRFDDFQVEDLNLVAFDDFTRANSTTSLGVVPIGGQTWTRIGTSSQMGISSNQAYPATAVEDYPTVIDAGVADNIAMEVKCTVGGAPVQLFWRVSPTNFNYFMISGTVVYRASGSTWTQVATIPAIANNDIIRVELKGNVHTIFRNGTQVAQFTDAAHNTNTRFGLGGKTNVPRYDDFKLTLIGAAVVPSTVPLYQTEDFLDTTYVFPLTGAWTQTSAAAPNGNAGHIHSGTTAHSATKDATMTLTVPAGVTDAKIEIDWYSDTEQDYDFFRILIDGTQRFEMSGTGKTGTFSYPLTAGAHTIVFRYIKDGSAVGGADRCYVSEARLYATTESPKVKIGELRVGGVAQTIPIYSITNHPTQKLRVNTTNGIGFIEVVPVTDALASKIRVRIGTTTYALKRT